MTTYVGRGPTAAAVARDLEASRAVLVTTGGCPCSDALLAETRAAPKESP